LNGSGAFSRERKESPIMFFVSQYNLYEVAVAASTVVARIRERFADDPVMLARAGVMEPAALAVLAAFEGVDTRLATEAVSRWDGVRDNDVRAIDRLLSLHRLSAVHAATAGAAEKLYLLLFGDGLDFLKASYNIESARIRELLAVLDANPEPVRLLGLPPYVEQLRASQARFEAEMDARGQLRAGRPEQVTVVRRPLHRALRATLMMFEERENTADVKYALEPLTRLTRDGGPAAPPAPETPAT
jgi:hypothetical protein